MSLLDEREKGFEAKYRLDEELAFKVNVRGAKLLGLWVADRLGLGPEPASLYARSVVENALSDPSHKMLLKQLEADLAAKGLAADAAELERQREGFLLQAKQELQAASQQKPA